MIDTGNAHVWLGDKEYDAQAGALVFIPAETWVSLKNTGKEKIYLVAVWDEPGFEEMLRCESVPRGQAAEPISSDNVEDCYPAKEGITLKQNYDAETLSGGMSLVASTGGFTLLPLYVRNALIPSLVARPLRGEVPTIGLMMGYNKSNTSSLLKRFLLRADELVNRVFQGEAYSRALKRGHRKPSV